MAENDSTNLIGKTTTGGGDLAALSARLIEHADGIENIAARGMAHDMRLAAQAIEHLMRPTAEDMPIGKEPPEFVSITSVKALLNRLLDHQASGDEALHADIETAGRLIFTLWDVIKRAGIHDPAIESTPTDLFVDITGDDGIALLRAGIQRAIESTTDPVCRDHLRQLLGEG